MRFVVDTNILISAFFWGGVPGQVLEVGKRSLSTLVTSEDLLAELLDVLERDKFSERLRFINLTPTEFLRNYRELVDIVPVEPLPQPVCDDPDDDAILACAVSGEADYIVSGDDDLLRLVMYENIPIVKPAQFLSLI
ncbi:MAG: putative toxin-antitoxin system toxin component, PIN family [Chloroflexi bacterium]|nr:putative toxin-antitoxin system toxin component, PIN family [Chloroflexota bacterium]MCC6896759.1 putative toxin-antitoxin system toxin component, PIN family [Anaerolineae bacterium]